MSATRDMLPEQLDATGRNFAVRRMLGDELEVATRTRLRVPQKDLFTDLQLLRAGVLDRSSFKMGYQLLKDPTEVVFTRLMRKDEVVDPALIVRDPRFFTEPVQLGPNVWADKAWEMRGRVYTAIRRQHNLRTTNGRDQWQRMAMFGDIASDYSYTGKNGTATGNTSTSMTNSGAAFPTTVSDAVTNGTTTVTSATAAFTNMDIGREVTGADFTAHTYITAINSATSITISQAAANGGSARTLSIARLQGKLLVTGSRQGVIVSHSATALTIDQWYDNTSTSGAAAGTPGNVLYHIAFGGVMLWVGLCATGGSGNPPTGGHAPAAGDVLRQADGLYAVDGTYSGSAAEQTASGLARAYIVPTFPAAGQVQLSQLFTYTGSVVVTLDVAILSNSKASIGSLLLLATQLNASAAVSANGDTVTPTWTINL